jgi:cobyrinic acid a,c-diamide synthase
VKGVVVGGTASGVGKTVATLAVIEALREAGREVQPAKAGPDFIDPSHHRVVADKPSRTLDLWLEGEAGLRCNYARGEGDVCIVEGVMGLYDGDVSSTAAVAEALELPVVLVVDAAAGMESVAAMALGFREYARRVGREVEVAGVIAQRAGGGRHAEGVREALPDSLEYLGRVPPDDRLEIPDRHLGLHMGEQAPVDREALTAAAEGIRADRLLALASEPPGLEDTACPTAGHGGDPSDAATTTPTVAVARDEAFAFLYPAVVERLRELGNVVTVSPLAGDPLGDVDAFYLPGGYPELHLQALADSATLAAVAERAAEGVPVYGECGGFMALCRSLTTADGETAPMAGILPAEVRMHDRYQALDHAELEATHDSPVANAGERVRGHEFHYSSATLDRDARLAFETRRGDGLTGDGDGLLAGRTLGTYCHTHVNSGVFDALVESARASGV